MATEGAFNGTNVFLRVNDGANWLDLGGQISHTETLNNGLVDITNKIGSDSKRELLSGEGVQSVDYSVELLFVSQAGYDFTRALAGNKSIALFQVVFGDIPTGFVSTELNLQVQSFADTSANGEAFKGTVSLLSSDEFEFDANIQYDRFLTASAEPFKTASGEQFYVRRP